MLLEPLYGLTGAVYYFHLMSFSNVREYLIMKPTVGDFSLFTKEVRDKLEDITGSYVYGPLSASTINLEKQSRATENNFYSSPRAFDYKTFARIQ